MDASTDDIIYELYPTEMAGEDPIIFSEGIYIDLSQLYEDGIPLCELEHY
ncbi:MAG: hypothetical protein R3C11_23505 [Planctomycetaceae bacterium]